jgi:hypothetical protein
MARSVNMDGGSLGKPCVFTGRFFFALHTWSNKNVSGNTEGVGGGSILDRSGNTNYKIKKNFHSPIFSLYIRLKIFALRAGNTGGGQNGRDLVIL